MTFQVDQCKNFKDGKVCEKCGRMMPAYCKDQQDLEDKARKYDEWVASQQIVETEHVVVEEAPEAELVEDDKEVVFAEPTVPTPQKGRSTKGRRK